MHNDSQVQGIETLRRSGSSTLSELKKRTLRTEGIGPRLSAAVAWLRKSRQGLELVSKDDPRQEPVQGSLKQTPWKGNPEKEQHNDEAEN